MIITSPITSISCTSGRCARHKKKMRIQHDLGLAKAKAEHLEQQQQKAATENAQLKSEMLRQHANQQSALAAEREQLKQDTAQQHANLQSTFAAERGQLMQANAQQQLKLQQQLDLRHG